ncbi:fimbria/pilus outer membrane usher protein [Paraburkholderia sp. CNPSo 3281]|uniref:fimbria/pilus outer membrane usher protein n=1 Tax=Paraburkholderia sp. CNPSo 3281 TaxID=2940933 RepID=UPI0020B87ABB|nr:fimbria/pilus outer membrane usher protein [Paraburkholderia sp. CNPSo 3281]MCP3717687.1 fimbrial biogenesis outer membrane usher protein [Paraburkholderia sp. CNPSo 3281]
MNVRNAYRLSGLRLRPLCACVLYSLSAGHFACAAGEPAKVAQVQFNDTFLNQFGPSSVDISRFDKGNVSLPGQYRADLFVNEAWLGRAEVSLKQMEGERVEPCFDRVLLERMGIDLTRLPHDKAALLEGGSDACAPLSSLIDAAAATFDSSELRLDVSIPQAALSRRARGYVDPRYWDDGVPAAILQYNGNIYHAQASGASSTQSYLGLNAGVNVGAWRFRHNGSLTNSNQTGTHYQSIQTSLQRAIAPLKSQLVVGDAFTDGAMFDSVGFRGVQLATDDRMYPESQRGYAPTIRGIARSNALVQVTQNGNVLYETNVAPGPFEIDDLYATGYGGNLQVVVTEADGSQSISVVPFAAAVNALRPGITRFSITAGQYRDAVLSAHPGLAQATVQHGFTNLLTGYGGVTIAEGYAAAVIGTALNTPIGAFGLDLTQSSASLGSQPSRSGQSLRLSYSKLIAPTNTDVAVAAYRYSSSGYLSLRDAMSLRETGNAAGSFYGGGIQRNSLQVTVNQSLPPGYGAFYLTGSTQDYWNRSGTDTQFQAGYNNSFRRLSYNVSVSRQYMLTSRQWDNRFMLTVGIPLGTGAHAPYSSTSLQTGSDHTTNLQTSVTGTAGVDNAFSYGVNAGYTGGGNTRDVTNAGGNVAYRSPVTTVTASASTGTGYNQTGGGLSGGIVAYGGGVAFTPAMGETIAIVEARDAAGARVTAGSGLRVDPWGHAIVTNLTPFASNEIEIDPKGLPVSVELKSTMQRVAPTSGAVVRAKFETDNPGASLIIKARMADGTAVPFGAQVHDAAGNVVGTVAQGGRIVVRGLKSGEGDLTVQVNDAANKACQLHYVLPKAALANVSVWSTIEAVCDGVHLLANAH